MADFCCRFCGSHQGHVFADLGTSPLSNAYLKPDNLAQAEVFYPLKVNTCEQCLLVQLPELVAPEEIFSDYLYFSSYSDSWLSHAKRYVEMMVTRFNIQKNHQVIEIASNDGYLLQYYHEKGIPVLGIEPAANVAEVAIKKGIPTRVLFFGTETARLLRNEGVVADFVAANNVLAHVPNLNDFVQGLKLILAETGVITIEFPHLLKLMAENQFDTIYHEHFSYFSLLTLTQVFQHYGLQIFDVETLPVHGGSLRIFVKHEKDATHLVTDNVAKVLAEERAFGLAHIETYQKFSQKILQVKHELLSFLLEQQRLGKKVVAYGAPAKGNTLLNYCGVSSDLIAFTVDRSPHKQQHYLPGSRIPIYSPDAIQEARPDYVLILPWNLKDEITEQMACIKSWGGQFVVPIPHLQIGV